tara:strand:+ start:1419 stop:1796 length:378 start_codon:yes stop_codon:yes gene_type:complete
MAFTKLSIFYAFSAVALGALGAHYLEEQLILNDTVSAWEKAVLYQLVHALALFSLGTSSAKFSPSVITKTSWCWSLGILFFSGSLYGLALTKWKVLGPITPIGGLLMLAGWIILFFAKYPTNDKK